MGLILIFCSRDLYISKITSQVDFFMFFDIGSQEQNLLLMKH